MSVFTKSENWFLEQANDQYLTIKPLAWEVGKVGSQLWITVPSYTFFDVSVPRIMRWWVSPHDSRFLKAAALHDFALRSNWDRVSSASLFSEALRATKVPAFKRLICTLAVILWHWN